MSPDHWSKLTWDTVSAGGYDLFDPIGYLDRKRDRACKQRVIVTLTTCVMVLLCTWIQDDILFRKIFFDTVVSKLIIISKFSSFRWLYALKRSFRFNYSLRT